MVVLGPEDSVLLQLIRNPAGREWWITPGGALEECETAAEAAARELVEEIGLTDAEIGPEIWTRRHVFDWNGRRYDQRETFFLCRVPDRFEAIPTITDEQLAIEGVAGHRWWSVNEIESSDLEFAPRRLASLLQQLIDEGPPREPFDAGI